MVLKLEEKKVEQELFCDAVIVADNDLSVWSPTMSSLSHLLISASSDNDGTIKVVCQL